MREGFRKRVASLVSVRRRGRIDVNVMVYQELFQHLSGGYEEIAVAPLTTEFERIFRRCLGARNSII